MISWLLRVILLPAGIVWFVGKNQPNFGLAQSVVALFVFISFGEVLAQAPQLLSGPTAQLEAILKRMEPIIAKAAGPCAEKMP
jgi:hypothetical protein